MYEYWNIDWLAHHGVQGQRWGHRNGPPYPLSSDVSTGSRLKKGATGSIKKKTPKSGSGMVTKGTADKSFDKEWAEVQKQSAYDDVKDWLKEIYLEDNFDGYFDGENPMPGTKGIDEWGDRELISQAKYRLDKSGRGKNLSDKEIKQALIDAWNEHYNLPSENPKDKKDNPITSKEKSQKSNNKEMINRRLQNAKTRDQWDINFLEAVQNKPFTEQHITGDISDSAYKNKMLQEYKKYLEDPEKYWNSR